jgi:hypothetical protein
MPAQMTVVWPEIALARIHDAVERELLAASDAEIMEAAKELGMNPTMQGSAAFAGLKYPIERRDWVRFMLSGHFMDRSEWLSGCERLGLHRQRRNPTEK